MPVESATFMRPFDSAVVPTPRHYPSNDNFGHSKRKTADRSDIRDETSPFSLVCPSRPTVIEETTMNRNEIDIKGHDGVIYKGRIDVEKLPAVDLHKKSNTVLLAPPAPPARSRLDAPITHPPTHSPTQHYHHLTLPDLTGNQSDRNDLSSPIPNLEPSLPREESFT